jgi:hypothetical protein
VIDPRFVFLGAALSATGAYAYIRDTLRGQTAPNRVTWSLWTLEPLLAFAVMRQAHVGLSSVWTLVLGLIPLLVLAASFRDERAQWRIGPFDLVCGALSLFGLAVWVMSDRPVVALVSFVGADTLAALPTLRKAIIAPRTETAWTYLAGALSAGIVLLTLPEWTTFGALFPCCVLVMNTAIWLSVATEWGVRVGAGSLEDGAGGAEAVAP